MVSSPIMQAHLARVQVSLFLLERKTLKGKRKYLENIIKEWVQRKNSTVSEMLSLDK